MSNVQSTGYALRLQRVAPGSAFLFGLLAALVASIVTLIVLSLAYLGLDYFGVVSSANAALGDLMKFTFNFTHVLWASAGLTITYFILLPVLFWVSAVVFNLCAGLTGGLRTRVEEE